MKWSPVHWSALTLAACQALAIAVSLRQQVFLEENPDIVLPVVTGPGTPVIFFFITVAVLGAALALLPMAVLKILVKGLFLALYGWGVFVVLGLTLPVVLAGAIAVTGALAWLRWPRLWLHNLLLGVTLAGYGSVFGMLMAPAIALAMMGAVSVYDLISVKSGHMMWMVKKLTGVSIVPAFVYPKTGADWSLSLTDVKLDEEDERIVSLLGGGDVGFALILLVAVLASAGLGPAVVMAGALLLGLMSVYPFQKIFFKGGPTPAMPPITAAGAIAYGLMLAFGII